MTLKKILHLGDILITFGDFLENNAELIPTPMVEEVWTEYLKPKLSEHDERLEFLTTKLPHLLRLFYSQKN